MHIKTPPMGWNTWNTFGQNINEQLVMESADQMVEKGYKDAGYEYVVIDDCWSLKQRDENGCLVPDPEKFPHGMKFLADYIHSKGLKFGMYSCAGYHTCAGYPSSYGYEFKDAATFASWGVDFLKYDFCYFPDTGDGKLAYLTMANALRASGRDILFSACNWGTDNCWEWMNSVGAHMYRSTGDIVDSFQSYYDIAKSQMNKFGYSAENCYNDVDMLTVGMYGKGLVGNAGCGDAEYRQQFILWCMYCAPLMLGCDIRTISDEAFKLVTNRDLIAIDQDEANRPPVWQSHPWNENLRCAFKHLANGEYAMAFYNFSDRDAGIPCEMELFGIPTNSGLKARLTDVLTGECIGDFRDYINIPVQTHDVKLFKVKLVK